MEIKKSNKRTYKFSKKNKCNFFDSDAVEEWPEEYLDEEIKPVPEEIEEIEEKNEIKCVVALEAKDSSNKDIVYQSDRFLLTFGNRLGHISKEWLIEELRSKINTLDNQKEKEEEKKVTTRKAWFMVCEESYATGGGTHFHVFIFLSSRKKKHYSNCKSI